MEKVRVSLFVISIICVLMPRCQNPRTVNIKWVDLETEIDSIFVSKRSSRGIFILNDTLGMVDQFFPYDKNTCDNLEIDPNRLDFGGNRSKFCTIADAKVPFWIHKRAGSDTLFLVQNHQTFLFRVPEDCCGDSEDYWNWD
jgi:hypothetical protein